MEPNNSKRAPRMSEQPEMKSSDILKVPAFLQEKQERPEKKEKKIPYQN